MTSYYLSNADKHLPYRSNLHFVKRVSAKELFSIMLLCLLVLFLGGCGQLSNGQIAQSNSASQVAKGELTYVAIGASDAFGIGTDDPYNQSWPADLAEKFGSRVHFINLGIPGVLLHQALTIELPIALDAHPDRVTIWLAVNDIAKNVPVSNYSHDLDLMLSRLQASAPHALIAVGNMPDVSLLPYFNQSTQQISQVQILAYNTAIAAIVKRHHAILVDLYAHSDELRAHPEFISSDGLHLNMLGYFQLAQLFYAAFSKAQ